MRTSVVFDSIEVVVVDNVLAVCVAVLILDGHENSFKKNNKFQ